MDLPEISSIERAVVTGPDVIARAAERWILLQTDAVRRSYVADVLDGR